MARPFTSQTSRPVAFTSTHHRAQRSAFFITDLGAGLTGAFFDSSNNSIWTADSNTNRVYAFTTAGVLLSELATDIQPSGVAIVAQFTAIPEPSSDHLALAGILVLVLTLGLGASRVRGIDTQVSS